MSLVVGDVAYWDGSQWVNMPAAKNQQVLQSSGPGTAPTYGPSALSSPLDRRFHWLQASGGNQSGFVSGMNSTDFVDAGTTSNGDDADGLWAGITNIANTGLVARTSQASDVYDMRHNPKIECVMKSPSAYNSATDTWFFVFSNGVGSILANPFLGIVAPQSSALRLRALNPAASPTSVDSATIGTLTAGAAFRLSVRWDHASKILYGSLNGGVEVALDLSSWNGVQAKYGWGAGQTMPSNQNRTMKFGSFIGRWQSYPGAPA